MNQRFSPEFLETFFCVNICEGKSLSFLVFQKEQVEETVTPDTTPHSGVILWLIRLFLRRQQQQRRETLSNQSRRNTMTSADPLPTISETITVN